MFVISGIISVSFNSNISVVKLSDYREELTVDDGFCISIKTAAINRKLNDDFFIDTLNSIEKIINFVDRLIDNLGGLKGVLTAIGAIVTKVFANQLS